jgi:hypothetical protein
MHPDKKYFYFYVSKHVFYAKYILLLWLKIKITDFPYNTSILFLKSLQSIKQP